jgi:hypothetical protein
LRQADRSLTAIDLTLGLLGMAAYYASNMAFEMLAQTAYGYEPSTWS